MPAREERGITALDAIVVPRGHEVSGLIKREMSQLGLTSPVMSVKVKQLSNALSYWLKATPTDVENVATRLRDRWGLKPTDLVLMQGRRSPLSVSAFRS